jgi:hypothetical protein
MRKVVSLFVSLGLVATLGLVAAAPAGATAPAGTKLCDSLKSFSGQIDAFPTNGTKLDKKAAAGTAKALKKASSSAPRKVRNAMRKIANAYQQIADGDSFIEVFVTGDPIGIAKAFGTFGTYYAKNCLNVTLPTNG